jgi:subtilisin family serine protease
MTKDNISTSTFTNINKMTDNYFQHYDHDKRFKIAVLDTGLDRGHDDFKQARTKEFKGDAGNVADPAPGEKPQNDRILGWHNFCPDKPEDDVDDLDGHGTQVAGIILRLAPNADLYIARVCIGDINNGRSEDQIRGPKEEISHAPDGPEPVAVENVD